MNEAHSTAQNRPLARTSVNVFGRWWLLILTASMTLFFGLMQPNFLRANNLLGILSNACLAAIAGCGLTCVMATGEVDFSAGSAMTIAACTMSVLLDSRILNNYVGAMFVGILAATLMGAFNAFLHLTVGIPAFLATLSSSLVVKGIAYWITDGTTLYRVWDSDVYTYLGQHYLFGIFPMPFVVLVCVGVSILCMK